MSTGFDTRLILKWMDDWEMDIDMVKSSLSHFEKGYTACNPEQYPFVMAIRTKDSRLIGICGFGPKEELSGEVEIAYFIDEIHSGK